MSTPAVSNQSSRAFPFRGIRVIDLSHVYNGPFADFLMAMAGAEVIKVELLTKEHLRRLGDMG
jgi:formyl-CoA transferase